MIVSNKWVSPTSFLPLILASKVIYPGLGTYFPSEVTHAKIIYHVGMDKYHVNYALVF